MGLLLILKRVQHEWRQLGVLLLSICLVSAFFSLGPFYVRTTTQSGLQYALTHADATVSTLALISPSSYRVESWEQANRALGPVNGPLTRISRTAGVIRGFAYRYGEPTTEFTPRSEFGYRAYAFSNLLKLVRIVDGRWPNRLPPPNSPELHGTTTEDAIAKGIGIFSKGDVEAVITPAVAKNTRMGIGSRFVIGERPENRVVVHIVGVVEAVNGDDPIWQANGEAINGEVVETGPLQKSFNVGFMVTEGAYTDWIARATINTNGENNTYIWQIALNTSAITADNFSDLRTQLGDLRVRMAADYPGLTMLSTLPVVLDRFSSQITSAQGPVLLLSGAILMLMLYHLSTTVSLILEQQLTEWSLLSSRGASTVQLVRLQLLTVILLCAMGFLLGPLIAALIMSALVVVGPMSTMSGSSALLPGIPAGAYLLSAVAVIAALIVLTLPAAPAARRSLAEFKRVTARPPSQTRWEHFGLDLVLILLGIAFLARLLFFVSGDLSQTLTILIQNPRQLIQLILDNANKSGGLNDPLNMLGPALLLTGLALFWLRLFPYIMRLLAYFVRQNNGLIRPLSIWNIERDPTHYAQLVLLLIATLALGTAALSLGATREAGAWSAARLETGGDARIDFDQAADQFDWRSLPNVTNVAPVMNLASDLKPGQTQAFFLGISPSGIEVLFPDSTQTSALQNQPVIDGTIPVIISQQLAIDEGRSAREDKLPLQLGAVSKLNVPLLGHNIMLPYRVVAIVRDYPTLSEKQHFLIFDSTLLAQFLAANGISNPSPNQLWLTLKDRLPVSELNVIARTSGVRAVTFAWDSYNVRLHEPISASMAGILYAGFWVSLLLGLLDFGFYLAVSARQRSIGFAVLQALGWDINHVWSLLLLEQAALAIPALFVGAFLGAILAYVILPFLALAGGVALQIPIIGLLLLIVVMLIGFGLLLTGAAWWLRRLNVNQVLRLGEE